MIYDTKIAVIVRDDLAVWQKLNVASFITGGLSGTSPELVGAPYQDGDGRVYGPNLRQPILVFATDAAGLQTALKRTIELDLKPSIYTAPHFGTNNDVDNRAAIANVPTDQLDLVGLAVHADKRLVNKVVKDLKLHP
ncbi:DUF2000 family protein [Roseiterribacter gracilis]|uniref:DUF2000 domain-containing protein n=1 Tax=Roseiterribacter gracilis TaxID=2812848 RepID=A0A8S8X9F7_9PROT|nr:hypothetical protein TMPK1_01070 [Rhodospirillales bacterium TMPK1]